MKKSVKIYKENYENLPERFAKKIEHDISYLLDAGIPDLKKIYLFGSCARGEVRSSSDVDLMVLTEHRIKDREKAANIRWTLDEEIQGVATDIVFMHEEQDRERTVFGNVLNRDKKLIVEVLE